MFSIVENEKMVCPKRIIKGTKERKIKKDIKYEPHKKEIKINHESVHIQMPLLLVYFLQIRLCAACQNATIHDDQTV